MKATFTLLVLLAPVLAFADAGDDTLLHFMKKCDLVVAAEIASVSGPVFEETGAAIYHVECKKVEGLHGQPPAGDTIHAIVTHPELEPSDRLPILPKGARCLLFLKQADAGKPGEVWHEADVWFSIQQYNSFMARRILALSKELAKAK